MHAPPLLGVDSLRQWRSSNQSAHENPPGHLPIMQARKRQKANTSPFAPGSSAAAAGPSSRSNVVRRQADSDESSDDNHNRSGTKRQNHKRKRTAASPSPVRSLATPPVPTETVELLDETADVGLKSSSAAEYQYYTELTRSIQWERQVDTLEDLIKLLATQYYSAAGILSPPETIKRPHNSSKSISHPDDVRGEDVVHPDSILYRAPPKPSTTPVSNLQDEASDADEYVPDTDDEEDDDSVSAAATSPSSSRKPAHARRQTTKQRADTAVYMAKAFDQSALEVMRE